MQAHTATPKLCCPYCDRRFHLSVYFEEYLQHHKHWDAESTEEHVCKSCPKKFLSSSELSRHMSVHAPPETEGRGEPLGRKGKEMSRGIPLIRERLPEKEEKQKVSSVSESESPTDSDSDCEVISGVASGGREAEDDGLLEKAGEISSCEKSDKKVESSGGEDTMSPVCSDDELEQEEEGEKDRELIAHFKNPVQLSGPHYLTPRCEYNRRRGRDPKYKCEWCGRMYLSQHGLTRHLEVHKQVPHPCKCCGKVFMTVEYLRRHLRSSGML